MQKREGGKETQTERERMRVIREKLTLPPFPDKELQCLACHAPGTCRKPAPSVAQPRHSPCSPCTANLLVHSSYKVQYTYIIHIPDQLVVKQHVYHMSNKQTQTKHLKCFFNAVSLGDNKSKKNSNTNRCKLIKEVNNWLSSTKVIAVNFVSVCENAYFSKCMLSKLHSHTNKITNMTTAVHTNRSQYTLILDTYFAAWKGLWRVKDK